MLRLLANGININDIVLFGHSLGAHICGVAGYHIQRQRHPTTKEKLKFVVIIGLDPAKILFQVLQTVRADRLDDDDAIYVIIMHAATGYFGVETPCGHLDLYLNGGDEQPGCNVLGLPYPLGE